MNPEDTLPTGVSADTPEVLSQDVSSPLPSSQPSPQPSPLGTSSEGVVPERSAPEVDAVQAGGPPQGGVAGDGGTVSGTVPSASDPLSTDGGVIQPALSGGDGMASGGLDPVSTEVGATGGVVGDPAAVDPLSPDAGMIDPSLLASGTGDPALTPDISILGVPVPTSVVQAWDMLTAGGPVVMILAAMSVVALAVVLLKLWQFQVARLGRTRVARDALALYTAGRVDEAIAVAGRCRNPVAQALARAMRGQALGLPEPKVREEVLRTGTEDLHALRGWLRVLEVIASLAPLLGLFGTVLGMIEAFRQLEAAGNQVNPAILSGGIWEALLTTAVGLAVAIPTVAILNWLERKVDTVAHEMDVVVTRVFTEDLSHDALAASQPLHQEQRHDGSRRLAALRV